MKLVESSKCILMTVFRSRLHYVRKKGATVFLFITLPPVESNSVSYLSYNQSYSPQSQL